MVVRGMSKIGTKRAREWIFPDRLAANRRQTPASASGGRSVLTLVMCGFRHLQASTLGRGCRKNEPKKSNERIDRCLVRPSARETRGWGPNGPLPLSQAHAMCSMRRARTV